MWYVDWITYLGFLAVGYVIGALLMKHDIETGRTKINTRKVAPCGRKVKR